MRTRHWFERARHYGSIALFVVMVGFVAHWIYHYDVCVRSDAAAYPQGKCLLSSAFETYFTWFIEIIVVAARLVTTVL